MNLWRCCEDALLRMSLQALSLDHETVPETAALLRELLASSTATPQHFESLTKQLLVVAEKLPPQSLGRWDLEWFHQSSVMLGAHGGLFFWLKIQIMVHPFGWNTLTFGKSGGQRCYMPWACWFMEQLLSVCHIFVCCWWSFWRTWMLATWTV